MPRVVYTNPVFISDVIAEVGCSQMSKYKCYMMGVCYAH